MSESETMMGLRVARIDGQGHYLLPVSEIQGYWESACGRWLYVKLSSGISPIPVAATRGDFDDLELPGLSKGFERPTRDWRVAFIYAMGEPGGPYKVGYCKNVERRLAALCHQWDVAFDILATAQVKPDLVRQAEKEAHAKLAEYAIGAELFNCSLETAIEAVMSVGHKFRL